MEQRVFKLFERLVISLEKLSNDNEIERTTPVIEKIKEPENEINYDNIKDLFIHYGLIRSEDYVKSKRRGFSGSTWTVWSLNWISLSDGKISSYSVKSTLLDLRNSNYVITKQYTNNIVINDFPELKNIGSEKDMILNLLKIREAFMKEMINSGCDLKYNLSPMNHDLEILSQKMFEFLNEDGLKLQEDRLKIGDKRQWNFPMIKDMFRYKNVNDNDDLTFIEYVYWKVRDPNDKKYKTFSKNKYVVEQNCFIDALKTKIKFDRENNTNSFESTNISELWIKAIHYFNIFKVSPPYVLKVS